VRLLDELADDLGKGRGLGFLLQRGITFVGDTAIGDDGLARGIDRHLPIRPIFTVLTLLASECSFLCEMMNVAVYVLVVRDNRAHNPTCFVSHQATCLPSVGDARLFTLASENCMVFFPALL
jgi:hypothetical protein